MLCARLQVGGGFYAYEQSIEGQLTVCYEYAKAHQYTVIGEYIDRAQSGTTDNRTDFQRMIQDSEKHTFQGILVYQLDRFARNRYDSAINKAKLKKNGVRVLSTRENTTEDASGILIEGVLESMAEYYSVELSQKINASKCLSNGGKPGLGYKVDKDHRYYVDEEEAKIVREIFQRYAYGERAADIIRDLNDRRITTSLGREFNKNSLHRLLRNRRYIGFYRYKGIETPNGMPRIKDHSQSGAVMAWSILNDMGCDPGEMATIVTAIGNHDERTGVPVNAVAAALILADKADVRRSRVRNTDPATFDIHDRVNYSVKKSALKINEDKTLVKLKLTVDTKFGSVMEFFEIFMQRMVLCRKAAERLGLQFKLIINEQQLI